MIYALVLNGELEEALRLLEAMEDGSDERLPRPTCAAYAILMPALATYEGIPAARRLIARQMARGIHVDSLSHLLMAVIYAGRGHLKPNLQLLKAHVRRGERLMRRLRSRSHPYPELKPLGKL